MRDAIARLMDRYRGRGGLLGYLVCRLDVRWLKRETARIIRFADDPRRRHLQRVMGGR